MIGGWSNDAVVDSNTHVIDLTGIEHKYYEAPLPFDKVSEKFLKYIEPVYKGWLSLPFPDMRTPTNITTYKQWKGIAMTIREILKQGTDVLVACHGGHGRSGLFCAIVGYILGAKTDKGWDSPVEYVRKIHCSEAIETFNQEKFVYDILGLDIKPTRTYGTVVSNSAPAATFKPCPICGTQSTFIDSNGMCLGCKAKYEPRAKKVHNITKEDFSNIALHDCPNEKCMGLWKADICGHVVHDMLVIDGLCERCFELAEAETSQLNATKDTFGKCSICGKNTTWGKAFGVCYECQEELVKAGNVDTIHNSITDAYRAIPHYCEHELCNGLVRADKCMHVVHNQEIQDGYCEYCRNEEVQ